ncbi:MAG TPA: flagellar brake protein [Rhodocyclaceae bacterium]
MSLISAVREDFSLGVPLPWMLYGQDGSKLLESGAVLETEDQLESLLARKPLRELSWNGAATPQPETPEAAELDKALANAAESSFTFQDMRLRVGDRIQLQPPATVAQDRYIVKLIGYVDNVGLLVTAPLENGLRVPLRENDKVVARIFSSQKAFGFGSVVARVCKIPYDYLHLSFPDRIQGSVVRKSPRVRTNIIASIAQPEADGNDRQSGIIVNLSADGALLKARQPLSDKGQTIQLSFRVNLHNVDAYLTVNAIIRSAFGDEGKTGNGAAMFNHGIQFQNLPANDSVILQSLIYQQMIEQPQSLT